MFLTEPPPTQFDLKFPLLGIPVRVHPLFWLVSIFMGRTLEPKSLLTWVAAVFISILIHEMGHALAIRYFGWRPSVMLYALGGLASYRPSRHEPGAQMLISLAGPAAGFVLAGVIILLCRLNGQPIAFHFGPPMLVSWESPVFTSQELTELVHHMLYVNIWWGLVNLLPVYPLDGGQFLRELLYYSGSPDAVSNSLWVSVITGGAVAVFALVRLHDYYIALMFGFLAYSSFNMLQSFTGRGGGYGGW